MLSLRNVKVRKGDFILRVDKLDIRDGETIAVMGVSGSGKTTLLEVLAGLEPCAEGKAENAVEMSFGYQNPYLQFFTEKVSSEILFSKPKMEKKDADKLVSEALSEFLLPGCYKEKSPYELSGGEARRVLLASISSDEKPYLFLDECLSGLDEEGETALRDLIDRRRKSGRTTIFTSHDSEFSSIAERLLLLKDGVLCYDGNTRDILSSSHEAGRFGLKPTFYATIAEDMGIENVMSRVELVEAIMRRRKEAYEK